MDPNRAGPARASHLPSGQASGDGGGTPSTGGCPWAQTCRLLPQPTTQPVPKPAGVAVPTRSWGGPAALRMLVPSWDPLLPPKVPLLPWPPTPPPSKVSQKLEKQLLLKNLEGKFHIIIVKILKFNVVKKTPWCSSSGSIWPGGRGGAQGRPPPQRVREGLGRQRKG